MSNPYPPNSTAWHVRRLSLELRKTRELVVAALQTPLTTLHELHVVEEDGSESLRWYLGPIRIPRRLHDRLKNGRLQ